MDNAAPVVRYRMPGGVCPLFVRVESASRDRTVSPHAAGPAAPSNFDILPSDLPLEKSVVPASSLMTLECAARWEYSTGRKNFSAHNELIKEDADVEFEKA